MGSQHISGRDPMDFSGLASALQERPLHYAAQPIRHYARGQWRIDRAEWLVRPQRHWGIETVDFIQGIVSTGQQQALDLRVLGDAVAYLAEVSDSDLAVNTMAASFETPTCVEFLLRQLEQHRIDPSRLVIEITEHEPFGNLECASEQINRLRSAGIRIGLDDVGAGSFTMTTVLNLSFVDYAKFDRRIVQTATRDPDAMERLKLLLKAARRRHLDVVVEGIETAEQIELILDLGVRMAQGFYWDIPEPVYESRPRSRESAHLRIA